MYLKRSSIVFICLSIVLSVVMIAFAQTNVETKPDGAGLLPEINRWRTAIGMRPYQEDVRSSQAAQFHSDDMANRDYFSHDAISAIECNGQMVASMWERADCFDAFFYGTV